MSGMHSSRMHRTRLVFFFAEMTLCRMAYFVVDVVPDSVAVIIYRPSASRRVGSQLTKIVVCCFVDLTCFLLLIC